MRRTPTSSSPAGPTEEERPLRAPPAGPTVRPDRFGQTAHPFPSPGASAPPRDSFSLQRRAGTRSRSPRAFGHGVVRPPIICHWGKAAPCPDDEEGDPRTGSSGQVRDFIEAGHDRAPRSLCSNTGNESPARTRIACVPAHAAGFRAIQRAPRAHTAPAAPAPAPAHRFGGAEERAWVPNRTRSDPADRRGRRSIAAPKETRRVPAAGRNACRALQRPHQRQPRS